MRRLPYLRPNRRAPCSVVPPIALNGDGVTA